jgi:hypothetical protein
MRTAGTAIAVFATFVLPAYGQDPPRPLPLDSVDLGTINAIVTVFRESRDSVWPGYDLSLQPFLVYRPGHWAVVLNPPGEIEGYRPYPESWPRLGAPALIHFGAIPALVGQLEFDFPLGRATMVAVPLADNLPAQVLARPRSLFAFVVHEAFHQFQRTAFGDVNEPSEEQYPILDAANSARAALEIHILEDAMRAVEHGDLAGSRRLTSLFLAQRRFRWEHALPLVREFERAKELSEGTAKYVETRLVANVAVMCRTGRFVHPYVCPSFGSVTVPGYLQADFESRLTDGALSPTDVARNRIYPTAAAMGVLLDFFSVKWKHNAANLPDSSTLADLLALSSPVPAFRLDSLRKEAEGRYDLAQVQRRTRTLIDAYVREADDAIRAFEAQPGYRVEVQLPAAGTSRSRSSSAKRWVVDSGTRVFSSEFLAYTLRRPNQQVFLAVERRAVLDDLVPGGERRVAFFVASLDSIRVNGAPVNVRSAGDNRFEDLSIRGAGFSLEVKVPGTLSSSAGHVAVRLSQVTSKDHGSEVDRARIQILVDSSEADAVLAIVARQAAGQTVEAADWQRLFATQPYLRLKKREASLHRDFTDAQFQQFVLSKELGQRAPDLARTLQEWKKADLVAAARRVLPYLPADAHIHVKVYPVIKPQTNSFVFEVTTNPDIFLFLDPALTRLQFENTVAHEMHHIGYASISDRTERSLAGLAPGVKTAVEWMGAFGEGFAMLAAAGSPDVHPHAFSKSEDRARWDHDMANFSRDVKALEKFFLEIIAGTLKTDQEISKEGFAFFGVQGAWYTVGYRMAVVIEKRDGRAALVECMSDPRKLLAAYNRAAAELNAKGAEQLALWSPELLEKIGAHTGLSNHCPSAAVT